MKLKIIFVCFLAIISNGNCGVLFWSNQNILLPSLKQFNNEDFDILYEGLNQPKVMAFRGDPIKISDKVMDLLVNKYTAYVPNANLNIDGLIELKEDPEENLKLIKEKLSENKNENILALIISSNPRRKRQAEDENEEQPTESPSIETPSFETPTGPMLYSAEGRAMLYSSKPPIIYTNNSTITLGKASSVTLDTRQNITRLSITVPSPDKKIQMFVKFKWYKGYWYLKKITVLDVSENISNNLTLGEEIVVSRKFSYHCTGETIFTDEYNLMQLIFYNLQIQPDTQRGKFNDAYDCVNFTTTPIWSGLFVSSFLIIVLMIGLGALHSIKTMDKFDNNKMKQLTITTSE